jgi:putative flippase GtrA
VRKRLFPFALAGLAGFLVDAAILLMVSNALGSFGGRALSFLCAVTVTWIINRNFAFADRAARSARHRELVRYVLAMLPGMAMNWLGYAAVVTLSGSSPATLVLAVAFGSLAGMATNLAMANWVVFRTSP